jgi:hypothetical protein
MAAVLVPMSTTISTATDKALVDGGPKRLDGEIVEEISDDNGLGTCSNSYSAEFPGGAQTFEGKRVHLKSTSDWRRDEKAPMYWGGSPPANGSRLAFISSLGTCTADVNGTPTTFDAFTVTVD